MLKAQPARVNVIGYMSAGERSIKDEGGAIRIADSSCILPALPATCIIYDCKYLDGEITVYADTIVNAVPTSGDAVDVPAAAVEIAARLGAHFSGAVTAV